MGPPSKAAMAILKPDFDFRTDQNALICLRKRNKISKNKKDTLSCIKVDSHVKCLMGGI